MHRRRPVARTAFANIGMFWILPSSSRAAVTQHRWLERSYSLPSVVVSRIKSVALNTTVVIPNLDAHAATMIYHRMLLSASGWGK